MNEEQTLSQIEQRFDDSKAARFAAKKRLDAANGNYHLQLMARRNAGETITQADMKAYIDSAIDNVPEVKAAYLNFTQADILTTGGSRLNGRMQKGGTQTPSH